MGDFNLAEVLRGQLQGQAGAASRDIEAITGEIIHLKQELARNIVDIGLRLMEAKAMLAHGEWLPWLEERVCFSEKTAQNYMRVAREFPNPQLVADLGVRKVLALLELPPSERENFAEENHIIDMTSRELEKALRERDTARREAQVAQAEARTAAESREKMETDMQALKALHAASQAAEEKAHAALTEAQAELRALREKPVEVAVETVADEAAITSAREEALSEMWARVDAAEQARKKAETQRKEVEKALSEAKKQAGDKAEILFRAEKAEAELQEARRQLESAAKLEDSAWVNANPDLAMFNVIFSQTQEQVKKMRGLRLKIGKDDAVLDEKLKSAINALADQVRRCAE